METLLLPHSQGGKKLLNIKARNEARELMKLKRYLNIGEARPQWATIADKLIEKNLAKKWGEMEGQFLVNAFLQSINVDAHTKDEGLPPSLRQMIKTARKYEVKFAPLEIDKNLKMDMPVWLHMGLGKFKNIKINTAVPVCL